MSAIDLDTLTLKSGAHNDFEAGACLLEATSYLAGEPWSDQPKCVSSVLGAYGRRLNDRLSDEDRQKLKVFIPRLIGTAGDGLDEQRGWLASDWAIRVATPRWLEAAGLTEHAERLRALPRIVDYQTARQARNAARAARDDASAARVKAREGLKARVLEKLRKRGVTAAAVADAAAAAVAAAAAAAADAVAAADADAAAAAVAVAAAAAAAVAAAAAAAAAADAVAAADAAAAGSWSETYSAAYKKLRDIYEGKFKSDFESKYAEVARVTNAEAIELLGRMIDPREAAAA